MVKLSKGGAYLINGTEIIEDSQTALAQVAAKTGSNITSEEAAKIQLPMEFLNHIIHQIIWTSLR